MTRSEIAAAYDDAATGWRRGPDAVYARMAQALVETVPVAGARVLDVGAGTGVAGAAALAGGAASVVAVDIATAMLRFREPAIAAAGADAARLPFRDGSFDLAVAAFSLGHLPDPVAALQEVRRVAGAVAASAFAPGWTHPSKSAVDAALTEFGFTVPGWYERLKQESEPRVNDPGSLDALAREAGFTDVRVALLEVESGLATPAEVVAWRFGMAHLAPFVATLAAAELERARAAAESVVAGTLPVVIPVLALSAS